MTAEQIHDALTLLPADLIAEADRKRTQTPRTIPWKRLAAMAACFVLVLGCSCYGLLLFGAGGGSKEQAAPEAAMMQAAESKVLEAPAAREPMEAAAEEELTEDTVTGSGTKRDLYIDHPHLPAQATETGETNGWCGNMTATVYTGSGTYPLSGSDAVTLTDILYRLDYRPDRLCRCMAEFTVDTEMGQGYEVNLTAYFVRFDGGQASLTEEQALAIRAITDTLEE